MPSIVSTKNSIFVIQLKPTRLDEKTFVYKYVSPKPCLYGNLDMWDVNDIEQVGFLYRKAKKRNDLIKNKDYIISTIRDPENGLLNILGNKIFIGPESSYEDGQSYFVKVSFYEETTLSSIPKIYFIGREIDLEQYKETKTLQFSDGNVNMMWHGESYKTKGISTIGFIFGPEIFESLEYFIEDPFKPKGVAECLLKRQRDFKPRSLRIS